MNFNSPQTRFYWIKEKLECIKVVLVKENKERLEFPINRIKFPINKLILVKEKLECNKVVLVKENKEGLKFPKLRENSPNRAFHEKNKFSIKKEFSP